MKIELKKIKHAHSLSQETNAFSAELSVDGVVIATCSNAGHGGETNIHPKYHTNEKEMSKYRTILKKAELFCKKLPKYKDLPMNLEFFVDLEVEKDLRQKDVNKILNKLEKDCLKNVVLISESKLKDFKEGKTNELPYSMFGWKKPISEIPVEILQKQLPAIKAKLKGDEIIYNKNLPK